ncbi:Rho termination factor N-terminal domain-containing protein [Rhizobium sp. 768_B6_N1_8]|uniref:Rho termination factor N-terminal domain-containing protein n=1 Tax=unclassified Rhizobium TaxID=2613769 RepID=UPI003F21A745
MRAKVLTRFPGATDDNPVTRYIEAGEVISGDLAKVAVDNGWAEKVEGDLEVETLSDDDRETAFSSIDAEIAARRAAADRIISDIQAQVDAARQSADAEIKKINGDVGAARQQAEADIAKINADLDAARNAANQGGEATPKLDDMTVDELKAYASDRGIDLASAHKKAEIIAAIEGAAKPAKQ